MAPGRPLPALYSENFTFIEKLDNKSNRAVYRCIHCNAEGAGARIENRDNNLAKHLADTDKCPNAPSEVRAHARRFMQDKAAASLVSGGMEEGNGGVVVRKKRRVAATLDGYVDHALTTVQQEQADVRLFRFLVHANIALRAAENPYFRQFTDAIRPSYMPATRYILSHRILDAERSRVEQDNIDRLKQRKRLTLLLDGWTDILGRELYGCVAAEINQYPIVLGLKDMTGVRTTGMNIFEAATTLLQRNDIRDGKNLLAVTTDNPSVMRNFRDRFQNEFYWVLTLPCFLHGLGNIIGAIAAFPVMKRILAKATRIVAFFEGSHYWGGQLDEEAQKLGVTRSMKQNCESRWYALALQAVSIDAYRPALQMICLRDEARRRINGLSPVAQDVINIVLYTTDFWPMLKQFHKTVAPLVDAIGNLESREATLADCMLELIRCARDFTRIPLEREENGGFWAHAKSTFNTRFHAMNTDVHQLALFLHPLCRKLAIHQAAKERSLTFMLKTAHTCRGHFSGGGENGLEWWESLPITSEAHPLKTLAIALFTVVPHAAEVERLFSQLGGVQTCVSALGR